MNPATTAEKIIQSICELQEMPDLYHPETLVISVTDLRTIIENKIGSEWNTIESFPKDRTSRLVWVPENGCIYCVSWRDSEDFKGFEIFGGGWRDHVQRATHWMALPLPPQQNLPEELNVDD